MVRSRGWPDAGSGAPAPEPASGHPRHRRIEYPPPTNSEVLLQAESPGRRLWCAGGGARAVKRRKINAISGTGKPRWLHAVEEKEPRLRAEAVGASYLVALAGAGGTGSGTWFRIGGIDFK